MKKSVSLVLALMLLLSILLCGCSAPPSENKAMIFDPPAPSKLDINDGNFVAASSLGDAIVKTASGVVYLDPLKTDKFTISGFPFYEENGKLYRLDYSNRSKYNANLTELAFNTSGGKIRFRTNSAQIHVEVEVNHTYYGYDHMTLKGLAGIDVYVGTGTDRKWVNTASLSGVTASNPKYKATFTVGNGSAYQEVMIELPLYAGVKSISIGVASGSKICEALPYTYEKPVVFYGSSITQGGCASRPGNCFTNLLSRALDFNLVNLGFSGSAHGEQYMAELIGNLEMSAFVMDYDHNALDPKELKDTHYAFYKTVRNLNPDVPIIFITKSDVAISDSDTNYVRREIIKQTYNKAIEEGDNNVYFISGEMIYGEFYRDFFMVDGCHPNDAGMLRIAETIYPVLKEILNK